MTNMIDKKDELILSELKKNARQSTKAIAKHINIPRVTVHDRIQKMMERGIIKSFNVTIDYQKIGFSSEVFIFISFLPDQTGTSPNLTERIFSSALPF